jgi:hypothetical protein
MKFLIALLLTGTCLLTFAQQKPIAIDPAKDKKDVNGFTVQLRPAPGNTVLFFILKQDKIAFEYPMNPITSKQEGFEDKEDAFKVAEWMIRQYGSESKFPINIPSVIATVLQLKQSHSSSISQN